MKDKTRRTAKQDFKNTYDHADDVNNIEDDEQERHIPEFTMKKLRIAIGCLKKGKSADRKGIKAEDVRG